MNQDPIDKKDYKDSPRPKKSNKEFKQVKSSFAASVNESSSDYQSDTRNSAKSISRNRLAQRATPAQSVSPNVIVEGESQDIEPPKSKQFKEDDSGGNGLHIDLS